MTLSHLSYQQRWLGRRSQLEDYIATIEGLLERSSNHIANAYLEGKRDGFQTVLEDMDAADRAGAPRA